MRFGYAAITWGSDIDQAIDDISAVGFRGDSAARRGVRAVRRQPEALRELLERHRLTFAVLSSGNLSIDPAREHESWRRTSQHAQFVRMPAAESCR